MHNYMDFALTEPRTVVSGLAEFMTLEDLRNRDVVVLCNLKPAKLKGTSKSYRLRCMKERKTIIPVIRTLPSLVLPLKCLVESTSCHLFVVVVNHRSSLSSHAPGGIQVSAIYLPTCLLAQHMHSYMAANQLVLIREVVLVPISETKCWYF